MRKTVGIILLSIFVTVGGTACATHRQTGAAVGGVTGAGAGATIGAFTGGMPANGAEYRLSRWGIIFHDDLIQDLQGGRPISRQRYSVRGQMRSER